MLCDCVLVCGVVCVRITLHSPTINTLLELQHRLQQLSRHLRTPQIEALRGRAGPLDTSRLRHGRLVRRQPSLEVSGSRRRDKSAKAREWRERVCGVDKKLAPRNVLQRQNAANIEHARWAPQGRPFTLVHHGRISIFYLGNGSFRRSTQCMLPWGRHGAAHAGSVAARTEL